RSFRSGYVEAASAAHGRRAATRPHDRAEPAERALVHADKHIAGERAARVRPRDGQDHANQGERRPRRVLHAGSERGLVELLGLSRQAVRSDGYLRPRDEDREERDPSPGHLSLPYREGRPGWRLLHGGPFAHGPVRSPRTGTSVARL